MCGIAGLWSPEPVEGLDERFRAMIATLRHRGPSARRRRSTGTLAELAGNAALRAEWSAAGRTRALALYDEAIARQMHRLGPGDTDPTGL